MMHGPINLRFGRIFSEMVEVFVEVCSLIVETWTSQHELALLRATILSAVSLQASGVK